MLGRRRDDPRPPIEVLGVEPEEEATNRVVLGGERRQRRTVLSVAALAVVVLVGVGAITSGGGDDEAEPTTTSSTRRPTTSSSAPAVTAPHGPQVPSPTGGAALLLGRMGGRTWVHLDLDTGERTEVDMPSADGGPPVGVGGGVVVSTGQETRFLPLPSGPPVLLGGPAQVLDAGGRGDVWLVRGGFLGLEEPDAAPARPTVQLVDPRSGDPRSRPLPLPADGWAAGGTADSAIVVAAGRVYELSTDGSVAPLGAGDVLAVSSGRVLLSRCDDRARCGMVALDLATGEEASIGMDPVGTPLGRGAFLADDGRFAIVAHGPQQTMWFGHVSDGRTSEPFVPERFEPMAWFGGWLPGDLGYVTVIGDKAVRLVVDGGRVLPYSFPALAQDLGDAVVVIPP